MKRIKCEWCGHYYDLNKYETCPKCGGTSSQNIISENSEKKNINPIIWIFSGIGIILSFLLIIGLLAGDDESIEPSKPVESIEGDSKETDLECCSFCYDILNEQEGWYDGISYWICTECGTELYDDELIDTYTETLLDNATLERYYTDDYCIEVGNSKLYIPYVEYSDYNNAYMNSISANVGINLSEPDYENHNIDMYLISKDKKYRIITNNYSFYNENIKSINDILKSGKNESFFGDVELGDDYFDGMFEFLLVSIDNKEYKIPLRYTSSVEDWNSLDYEVPLSEKIIFGNNALYLDGVQIYSSFDSCSFYFNIQTNILDISDNEISFEVEDKNGFRYKLYEDSYFCGENNILLLEDITKNKIDNPYSISLVSHISYDNLERLIITINGVENFVNLK